MAPKPLIVIVGPTASGKTELAIELAERFGGEIICADSRTVYKYLDIGSAKPSIDEQRRIRHHLLDVVEPSDRFTVADFKLLAEQSINDIHSRGKLPIMVGGSGLYIDAVVYDYQFSDGNQPRDSINPRHLSKGAEKKKGEFRKNTLTIGLKVDKELLKKRITNRVDLMIEHGLIEEVRLLIEKYPDSKALYAPGYKAFRRFLDGDLSIEEAKSLFIKNDMQLAKRQMTWFRRNAQIVWLDTAQGALVAATNLLIEKRNRGKNNNIMTTS